MNHLAQKFLKLHDQKSATDLVRLARCSEFHHLGVILGKFMEKQFPHSSDIKDEHGITLFYTNKHEKAYFTFKRLLAMRNLSEEVANRAIFNQHFCTDHIANRYVHYDPMRMRTIRDRKKRNLPRITVTITSCKRFDLFTQTVNSFVNCCKDIHLVDEWLCVDDNSSKADRSDMQSMYPFITFYIKTPKEKGHPQSMNIIRNKVKTPYIFHMEDDWKFIERRNFLSDCLEVLGDNPKIAQCLINKNYAEPAGDHEIKGGMFNATHSGLRYYIHEFCHTQKKKNEFFKKHGKHTKHCSYWPHFSFRPSLIRTKIFEELGEFNESVSHFEMNYSSRYVNKGYISAFLEAIYCLHIGRLTSERGDKNKLNAYDLNNEAQFTGKEERIQNPLFTIHEVLKPTTIDQLPFRVKTFVINLKRRPDRWEDFSKHKEPMFLEYERFEAVDGTQLVSTSQLQRIFDHNDYNMRQGMVGCAMSHIKLCVQLLNDENADAYCMLEDDLDFVPGFAAKFLHCCEELTKTDWGMFYLGHHLWKQFIDHEVHSKTLPPKVEQFDRSESMTRSMGGTGGYLINKKGAQKLLDFINITGMTNGIDTVQQKSADVVNVFYAYPHLIYSECYRGDNSPDTDIQHNFESLTVSLGERIKEELKHNVGTIKINDPATIMDTNCYYESNDQVEIAKLAKECKYPCYTLDDRVIFVVPKADNGRYFHRFKKDGKWDIDDSIKYQ